MKTSDEKAAVTAALMVAISIISSIIGFLATILLARLLGPEDFPDYAIAVATLMFLATFCEFGTGKYAMRIYPEFVAKKEWGLLRGYWLFSILLVVTCSILLGISALIWENLNPGTLRNEAVTTAVWFLAPTALVAVVSEFVMANRRPVTGAIITRLVCPGFTLLSLLSLYFVVGKVSLQAAVVCFGMSGIVGLLAASWFLQRFTNPAAQSAKRVYRVPDWLRHCLWYSFLALLTTWLFKISVLLLYALNIEEIEVARFVAAMETACFILLVAKSTNKFYQPELATIISKEDWKHGFRMKRSRRLLIGTASGAYFLLMIFFGKIILGWFGNEFVDGYPALLMISAGTCVATTFAMAPEYLKFTNQLKTVLLVYFLGGLTLVVSTSLLAVPYGANGAAAAFGIVVVLTTLVFVGITENRLRKERRHLDKSSELASR